MRFLTDCTKVANNDKVITKKGNENDFIINANTAKIGNYTDTFLALQNVYVRTVQYNVYGMEKHEKRLEKAVSSFVDTFLNSDDMKEQYSLTAVKLTAIFNSAVSVSKVSLKDIDLYDMKATSYTSFIKTVCSKIGYSILNHEIVFKSNKKIDSINARIEKDNKKILEAENNEEKSIGNMNSKELKEYCKKLGLKGYSKLGKDALLDMIKASQRTQTEQEETVA